MSSANPQQRRPAAWVPTLYFAEGIPFFAVSSIAGILYKRWVGKRCIGLYTSLLLLPWSSSRCGARSRDVQDQEVLRGAYWKVCAEA